MTKQFSVTAHRTLGGLTVYAHYNGGPYIDLSWTDQRIDVFEVINVYDYALGSITSPVGDAKTKAELKRAVSQELQSWLRSTGVRELRNYALHTRSYAWDWEMWRDDGR